MKVCIVDYGTGNLYSLANAFRVCGQPSEITPDPEILVGADVLVLPGVGAFGDCIRRLQEKGIDRVIIGAAEQGKPILGICIGMQLLMDSSEEFGLHPGLGLIPGYVRSFRSFPEFNQSEKVPLIGWNDIHLRGDAPLLTGKEGTDMYFINGYCVVTKHPDHTLAFAQYGGVTFSAAVQNGNVYGCQFHPEKSSTDGLSIICNFLAACMG